MASAGGSVVSECGPEDAWAALKSDPDAQLVDVRTRAEWSFVGVPDVSALARETLLVEWRMFPNMQPNSQFADQVFAAAGTKIPSQVYFICRSGARSMEAARAMAAACNERGAAVRCVNVAEGFEGDLDQDRRRGRMNGWKARGLAWFQS